MAVPALRLVTVDDESYELPQEFVPVEGVKWLFTRNGIYYIVRKVNGDVRRTSLRTRDYDEALVRYRAKVGAQPTVIDGTVRIPEARRLFMAELETLRKPGTVKSQQSMWRHAEDLLAGHRVVDVDTDLIERILDRLDEYVSPKTGKPLAPNTKRKIKTNLSAMFAAFTKRPTQYRTDNPVAQTRKRSWERQAHEPISQAVDEGHIVSEREHVLIVEQLGILAADEIDGLKRQAFAELMYRSGLRISEALALEIGVSIVDGSRFGPYGSLKVERRIADSFRWDDPTTWHASVKGRLSAVATEMRYVVISKKLREILDAYIARGLEEGWLREDGLLFPSLRQSPLQKTGMQYQIRKAAEKAGIKRRIKSHFFRHSFATRLFTNGATVAEVAMALGNSEKVVKDVYIHFIDREQHSNRMAALAA